MLELSAVTSVEETAIEAITAEAGVCLDDCYQCGKCSAGCPMSQAMDYVPRKIIRLLQLGQYHSAIRARSPWICAECEVCSVRCPQEVRIAELMLAMRHAAKAAGTCPVRNEDVFDDIFIANIRRFGRSNEAVLAGRYNLQTGHLMQDVANVPGMLSRGMIGLKFPSVKDKTAVRALLDRALSADFAKGANAQPGAGVDTGTVHLSTSNVDTGTVHLSTTNTSFRAERSVVAESSGSASSGLDSADDVDAGIVPVSALSTQAVPARVEFAFFPGCSADSTGISFTLSMEYVCEQINVALKEIPDWCCCGTSAAKVTSEKLALALPARSLALAEAALPGRDVVAHCAGCFASLKAAVHYARKGDLQLEEVRDLIHMPYMASADVYSILEVLARDELSERLRDRLGDGGRQLEDLKIACYYGCALVRPPEITNFDDPENPQSMETLLRLGGAQTIDWAFKTECCGASHQITTPRTGRDLLERIFADAAANGANAIATACPLCMLNLDMREAEINRGRLARGEQPFDIPVYYFTEILGLALGGAPEQLGLNRHFWPVRVHDASASAGAGVDTGTVHLSAAESEAVA